MGRLMQRAIVSPLADLAILFTVMQGVYCRTVHRADFAAAQDDKVLTEN